MSTDVVFVVRSLLSESNFYLIPFLGFYFNIKSKAKTKMSGINVDSIGLASGTGIANNKSLPQSPASMVSSESETQSISDEQTTSTTRQVHY